MVEVLSPSTEAFDRGAKFAHSRLLQSLAEYLIIDIETRTADLYRKASNGMWMLQPYSGNDLVKLASVELELPLDAVVFEDVDNSVN